MWLKIQDNILEKPTIVHSTMVGTHYHSAVPLVLFYRKKKSIDTQKNTYQSSMKL